MRILEILIIIFVVLRFLAGLKRHNRWLDWFSIAILFVSLLHLLLEGYRWQMVPAYAVVLILAILAVSNLRRKELGVSRPKWRTILLAIGILLLLIIIVLPPVLLPVPEIYLTDGPYQVGTTTLMLVDNDREEIYSGKSGEPRRLMVQLWYPTAPVSGADFAPWVEDTQVIAPALSEFLGFPPFFLDHLKYANGHAFPGALIAEGDTPFPLLVFSHGWSGFRAQNTFQMVALASQGYVVAAPDHSYGAIAAVFPGGDVAYKNPNALPMGMGLPNDEFMAAAHQLGLQWAGDLSFVVDSLQEANQNDELVIFQDLLDFSKVGALGHSTGGGAALQFCALDNRCGAVLALDAYLDPVDPEALSKGISSAVLGMFSESGLDHDDEDGVDLFKLMVSNSTGAIYHFEIQGTKHYDFTDLPAFSPLASTLGLKGPINGARALGIITDYTLAFFGQHLLGVESDILSLGVDSYPELVWK